MLKMKYKLIGMKYNWAQSSSTEQHQLRTLDMGLYLNVIILQVRYYIINAFLIFYCFRNAKKNSTGFSSYSIILPNDFLQFKKSTLYCF